MARAKRAWVAEESGAYHLISRVAGGELLFGDEEKEYFLELLERYAQGFYVDVHSFCIMSNHFHILATGCERRAENATPQELIQRYKLVFGADREIPEGAYQSSGEVEYDEDGGIERLRARLGSISRFVQELKQAFSRWYNKKHKRKGYLWGDRFKGVLVCKDAQGDAMLSCSSYIELNPIRAGIVKNPEAYRFSSMGLKVRSPKRHKQLITSFRIGELGPKQHYAFYRQFVFETGGIEVEGKAKISQSIVERVRATKGRLGLGDKLRYRFANFSEGLAIGTESFICSLQKEWGRRFIKAREINNTNGPPDGAGAGGACALFATRQLNGA